MSYAINRNLLSSDPVTRGLSITVNWLGIQVDVRNCSLCVVHEHFMPCHCKLAMVAFCEHVLTTHAVLYIQVGRGRGVRRRRNIPPKLRFPQANHNKFGFSTSSLGRVLVSTRFIHTSWHHCHHISQGPPHYTH